MLTGKTHETFFHTAVLSLRLHKGESPFGLKALNIDHFQTSSHQLTCHRPNRKNSQSIGLFGTVANIRGLFL